MYENISLFPRLNNEKYGKAREAAEKGDDWNTKAEMNTRNTRLRDIDYDR
jgi:hypothetical protein